MEFHIKAIDYYLMLSNIEEELILLQLCAVRGANAKKRSISASLFFSDLAITLLTLIKT
jgi:hypothetical protein